MLAAMAAGILFAVMLVWSTISSERAERRQTVRYAAVVSALRDINRAALNAETGQRGYFITLDRRYLASYEFGSDLYPRALAKLKHLSAESDDAQITSLVGEIETAGNAKFAELAQIVAMIERGDIQGAQQRILSNEGRVEMERLGDALARLEVVERAMQAEASQDAFDAEKRVLPLLALTMALMAAALGLGFALAMRAARAEEAAARAVEIEAARDRADLLARELNHRVKNLFAVILAIVRMSGRGSEAAAPVVDNIASRIHALLDAHEATQGHDRDNPGGGADMALLIGKVLAPYKNDNHSAEITGEAVALSEKQATPVGLVLHELATNAVKYGAWSVDSGRIDIGWTLEDDASQEMITLCWRESAPCIAEPDGEGREGFGTLLMRSSARQLGGTIERRFEPGCMIMEMRFPKEA